MKLLQQKKLTSLNPTKEPLTKEKLIQLSGCENLSEKEQEDILLSIQILSEIMFEFFQQIQSQEGKKSGIEISPNFNIKQVA
jgi:hypothetical protein